MSDFSNLLLFTVLALWCLRLARKVANHRDENALCIFCCLLFTYDSISALNYLSKIIYN